MKNSMLGIYFVYITLSWKLIVTEAAVQGSSQEWINFSDELVKGDLSIDQKDKTSKINVEETINGLNMGMFMLQLVSLAREGCKDPSPVIRANLEFWDQGNGENHTIEEGGNEGQDFMPNKVQQELSANDVAGLIIQKCYMGETGKICDEILACAPVSWSKKQTGSGLDWKMLVIIAVSILVFFLLIICIPLICCCIKKKKDPETSDMDMDIEDEYPPRSKSPMYDELSLPFIDASLPPTPKVGRIVNGLDILLGRGVSENSLVDKKSQVQW